MNILDLLKKSAPASPPASTPVAPTNPPSITKPAPSIRPPSVPPTKLDFKKAQAPDMSAATPLLAESGTTASAQRPKIQRSNFTRQDRGSQSKFKRQSPSAMSFKNIAPRKPKLETNFASPSSSPYKVRFVPLGGIVGVTKNMYLYELYNNNVLQDILIVDCGIGFPSAQELGVDVLIPDISYLKDKLDLVRAILLTHGHEDHIGALPYHYKALNMPPIWTGKLTKMFVENKLVEYEIRPQITEVELGHEYTFGGFTAKFIQTCHSIPDTHHIIIGTPIGTLYHGQDFKMDLTPPFGDPPDFYEMCKAGHDGVLALFSDALGSFREGLTLSEKAVGKKFEDEMQKTKGKFIMTTFASNISRIRQCVDAAVKLNRKVYFLGSTMVKNTLAAGEIGYLPIPRSLIGDEYEISKIPGSRVCIIATGSQGQEGSAMSRIAQNEHRFVKIKQGDKVFFSSDPIPGNEEVVYAMVEQLTVRGAEVIYSDVSESIHASGHGNIADLKLLLRFTKPKFAIPIGSTIRHHMQYQNLAVDLGHKKENVLLLNEGETITFTAGGQVARTEKIDTQAIYVDAYGVGDVGQAVLRDRQALSTDGVVACVLHIDSVNRTTSKPIVISRGFVFEKTQNKLLDAASTSVQKFVSDKITKVGPREAQMEVPSIKKEVIRILERFFSAETGRMPLVICEVIVS